MGKLPNLTENKRGPGTHWGTRSPFDSPRILFTLLVYNSGLR